jgi:hypothetical protein
MGPKIFDNMEVSELRRYIEFLLWHYRLVDAFWFLDVAERYGQSAAERINEQVWWRIGEKSAKDIVSTFQIQEKGLKGFVEAISYQPSSINLKYDIKEKPYEVIISVPACPPQIARRKRGMREFECKAMHQGFFKKFVQVIDDCIRFECVYAPPDPHPDDMFCKWRFYLENDSKK